VKIACAMTLEALFANIQPYDERLHTVRGFSGAIYTAQNLNKLIG
jgi:histidine ammonia-lyase